MVDVVGEVELGALGVLVALLTEPSLPSVAPFLGTDISSLDTADSKSSALVVNEGNG
jgi:hypothetical protein